MARKKVSGFTLIELMVVVVIIGIIAAIAYPNYVRYYQRARRADCEGVMMQFASAMERDFSRNNQYQDLITSGAFSNQCPLEGNASYRLDYAALTLSTYTLRAVPLPGTSQTSDACGTLTLTNTLQKGQSLGTTAECWQ